MSVNKAILIGRIGKDPEMRYTTDGTAVANLTLATNEIWKDKSTGERKERTEWHRIVAFRRLAEICGEYLSKGRQVFVEGRLQTRSWEKDGVTRYTTEIVADNIRFLGGKDDAQQPVSAGGGMASQPVNKPVDTSYGGSPAEQAAPPLMGNGPDTEETPF